MITRVLVYCSAVAVARAATLVVVNNMHAPAVLREPVSRELAVGERFVVPQQAMAADGSAVAFGAKERVVMQSPTAFSAALPQGTQRYAVLVLEEGAAPQLHDTNDLQVELSTAAHRCEKEGASFASYGCVAANTFGGLPVDLVGQAFPALWTSFEYWNLCNVRPPAAALRVQPSTAPAGHDIEVLREKPMVATVRGFLSAAKCRELMASHAGLDRLVHAHVGGGGGGTSTSEQRETLTNNMFVNWDSDDTLSQTAAATFDVVSEMLKTRVPYEGQEPVNFLHYLKGFEYKPHMDGGGGATGQRVATTLVYCEAADEGGGTVFPRGNARNPPLRYQPRPGDMLYFEYQPEPMMQEHSACPVIAGNKSTLTQWHRLGVSPEKEWYTYENWGVFHNPHKTSRWKGARYGEAGGSDEL